jgi:hypothetical protein
MLHLFTSQRGQKIGIFGVISVSYQILSRLKKPEIQRLNQPFPPASRRPGHELVTRSAENVRAAPTLGSDVQ